MVSNSVTTLYLVPDFGFWNCRSDTFSTLSRFQKCNSVSDIVTAVYVAVLEVVLECMVCFLAIT